MSDWADEIGDLWGDDIKVCAGIADALRKAADDAHRRGRAEGYREASSYCHARANHWCDHGDGDGKLVGNFEAACIELAARADKIERGEA